MIKEEKYEPARNDDRFNVHNIDVLTMWHTNVDFQPVLSGYALLKYIAKYASKAKKRSKSYHHMLARIKILLNLRIMLYVHIEGFLHK